MRERVLLLFLSLAIALSSSALTPPFSCNPVSFDPQVADPWGGQLVRLQGNFYLSPVRVFFGPKESFVVSRSNYEIDVVSPPFDVPAGESLDVPIKVLTGAGTPNETACTFRDPFRVHVEVFQPTIHAVSPSTGPVGGGTRVTIFGESFHAPVRVFFGQQEAQVVNITRTQIAVVSPAVAADGFADVRVVNVNENKEAMLAGSYRYKLPMVVTSISRVGKYLTSHGSNFDDPAFVSVDGYPAAVVRIEREWIKVVVPAIPVGTCAPLSVVVVNIDNGETVTGDYEDRCGAGLLEPARP